MYCLTPYSLITSLTMPTSYIETKVEEFEKKIYKILGLENDGEGNNNMLIIRDEDDNWISGIDYTDEKKELKEILESALTDLLTKCIEAVPEDAIVADDPRTEGWNDCRQKTLDNFSKLQTNN